MHENLRLRSRGSKNPCIHSLKALPVFAINAPQTCIFMYSQNEFITLFSFILFRTFSYYKVKLSLQSKGKISIELHMVHHHHHKQTLSYEMTLLFVQTYSHLLCLSLPPRLFVLLRPLFVLECR